MLHIAAKLGLKQFASALQKFPGYQAAVCIKNKQDKTASQIALHAGHTDLASNIQPPENFAMFQDKDVQSNYVIIVIYWFSRSHIFQTIVIRNTLNTLVLFLNLQMILNIL